MELYKYELKLHTWQDKEIVKEYSDLTFAMKSYVSELKTSNLDVYSNIELVEIDLESGVRMPLFSTELSGGINW